MSKVGKKPIAIPDGVTVQFEGRILLVTGPKGKLEVPKLENIEVTQSGNEIVLQPASDSQQAIMNWGTMRSLLANAVDGVTKGYAKTLEIEGVGFKASMEGSDKLVLKVGFSHLVNFPVPQGIAIAVEKNKIMVSGFDKHLVGQVAADIRKIKKPEPYLGKGIRYQGEVIRRKAGKKAGSAK